MTVTIYTDGACRGNPGPGGYGCVLLYTNEEGKTFRREISAGYEKTTNNRMEILGVTKALAILNRPCEVDLYTDSQYVVNAFTQGWLKKWMALGWYKDAKKTQEVKNRDLWEELLATMKEHQVNFHWVKGHAQTTENNRCDELAVASALDSAHWLQDVQQT